MPELVRGQLAGSYAVRRGAVPPRAARRSGRLGYYGAFRGMSPAGAARRRVLTPEENKENIPPREAGSSQRRRRMKRSPLPAWYPRTPLRDITVVLNAMERRRLRLRENARRRNRPVEASPVDASPSSPMTSAGNTVTEVASPDQSVLSNHTASSSETLPCPTELMPQLPLNSSSPVTGDACLADSAMKLRKTMDQIEMLFMEKLKDMPKENVKPSRRSALMSMR